MVDTIPCLLGISVVTRVKGTRWIIPISLLREPNQSSVICRCKHQDCRFGYGLNRFSYVLTNTRILYTSKVYFSTDPIHSKNGERLLPYTRVGKSLFLSFTKTFHFIQNFSFSDGRTLLLILRPLTEGFTEEELPPHPVRNSCRSRQESYTLINILITLFARLDPY